MKICERLQGLTTQSKGSNHFPLFLLFWAVENSFNDDIRCFFFLSVNASKCLDEKHPPPHISVNMYSYFQTTDIILNEVTENSMPLLIRQL